MDNYYQASFVKNDDLFRFLVRAESEDDAQKILEAAGHVDGEFKFQVAPEWIIEKFGPLASGDWKQIPEV